MTALPTCGAFYADPHGEPSPEPCDVCGDAWADAHGVTCECDALAADPLSTVEELDTFGTLAGA